MNNELEQLINQNIELSSALLDALLALEVEYNDDSLAMVNSLSTQRAQALHTLFSQHQQSDLLQFSTLLTTIAQLDSQLIKLATKNKQLMAKKVLKQRKNTKATNAYLSK